MQYNPTEQNLKLGSSHDFSFPVSAQQYDMRLEMIFAA
jgi:hypothetical protein